MSPDEKTDVATAEPEAEAQQLAPTDTPPVPGTEQEPSPADESEDESVASASEDEGEEAEGEELDIQAQLAEALKDADPEVLEALKEAALTPEERERLREEPKPAQDADEVDVRSRGLDRKEKIGQYQGIRTKNQNAAWGPLNTAFQEHAADIARQEQAGDGVTVDPSKLSTAMQGFQQQTADNYTAYTQIEDGETIQAAIESHPAFRYLSPETRENIANIKGRTFSAWIKDSVHAALNDVIERGAPAEVVTRERAKAQKDAGVQDTAKGLLELLGKAKTNGAKPEAGGGGKGSKAQPRNEAEARNWHATGKWTNQQMRAYLARANN